MMLAMLTDKNNLRWQVMTEKTGSVNIPGLFSHADIFLCVLLQYKKNQKILSCQEEPYFPLKEGYSFLESVPEEERVRGSTPPATKEDCEVS